MKKDKDFKLKTVELVIQAVIALAALIQPSNLSKFGE